MTLELKKMYEKKQVAEEILDAMKEIIKDTIEDEYQELQALISHKKYGLCAYTHYSEPHVGIFSQYQEKTGERLEIELINDEISIVSIDIDRDVYEIVENYLTQKVKSS